MRAKQNGFGHVVVLILFVVIAGIGFAGWYVIGHQTAGSAKAGSRVGLQPESKSTTSAKTVAFTDEPGDGWKTYTNKQYGFSIAVPKQFESPYGGVCQKEATSYRHKASLVDTTVIEDGEAFYVTEVATYQLTGMTESDGIADFSGCHRLTTTVGEVRKNQSNEPGYPQLSILPVMVGSVKDKAAIESKAQMFTGVASARIASMKPNADGWQDVNLTCDATGPEGWCTAFNYKYSLRYYETSGKLVYIQQGQAGKFYSPTDEAYDTRIVDSFKLLP